MFFGSFDTVRIRIVSADIPGLLTSLHEMEISVYDIKFLSELSVALSVDKQVLKTLESLIEKRGEELQIIDIPAITMIARAFTRRFILIVILFLLLLLTIYAPHKALFIRVEGNNHVSEEHILSAAEAFGIRFGISTREINSERFKNFALQTIPELQWAGIKIEGTVVTIAVQEREGVAQKLQQEQVYGIVAIRDGIIRDLTVTQGNPLCKVGDAVHAGQLLISPYTDCGNYIQFEPVSGEVYGNTKRTVSAVSMRKNIRRTGKADVHKKYSVKIGKILINFFKDSGISGTGCVKMYSEYTLMVHKSFPLPVSLIVTEEITYDTEAALHNEEAFMWVPDLVDGYLYDQMIAGRILERKYEDTLTEELYCYQIDYACREMIGRPINEVKVTNDGKRN